MHAHASFLYIGEISWSVFILKLLVLVFQLLISVNSVLFSWKGYKMTECSFYLLSGWQSCSSTATGEHNLYNWFCSALASKASSKCCGRTWTRSEADDCSPFFLNRCPCLHQVIWHFGCYFLVPHVCFGCYFLVPCLLWLLFSCSVRLIWLLLARPSK